MPKCRNCAVYGVPCLNCQHPDMHQFQGPQCLMDLFLILAKKLGLITGKETWDEMVALIGDDHRLESHGDDDDDPDMAQFQGPQCLTDLVEILLLNRGVIVETDGWKDIQAKINRIKNLQKK